MAERLNALVLKTSKG